jgi:hypothetical protein
MYSAFQRGSLPLATMGIADRAPSIVARLRREGGAEFPDPGPDHFAVVVIGSLRSFPSIDRANEGNGKKRSACRLASSGGGSRVWLA